MKCLVTITPKGQSLKFKASVQNIPTFEIDRNCHSRFKKDGIQLDMYFSSQSGFLQVLGFLRKKKDIINF